MTLADNQMEIPPYVKYGLNVGVDVKDYFSDLNINEDNTEVTIDASNCIEIFEAPDALNHPLFRKYYGKIIVQKTPFNKLHYANINRVLFIRVPEGVKGTVDLEKLYKQHTCDHTVIILEKNSSLVYIETLESDNALVRTNALEVFVGENASFIHASFQSFGDVKNFSFKNAHVQKGGNCVWTDCVKGSTFTMSRVGTELRGKNANGLSYGLFFGKNSQVFDLHTKSVHYASNTSSHMVNKGSLNNTAKTIYRGLIKILPGSTDCEAYQKEETLMLSEDAEINAIPELEIENDQVKCSHGVGIGQIDKDSLFYLMSRGLSKERATETIINGFYESIVQKMPDSIQDKVRSFIEEKRDIP